MADQIHADMESSDSSVANVAKQVRDSLVANTNFSDLLWKGYGVNSRVIQEQSKDFSDVKYTAIYESGQLQLSEQITIDVGKAAVFELTETPLNRGFSSGRLAANMGATAGPVSSVTAEADTYTWNLAPESSGGGADFRIYVGSGQGYEIEGLFKFDVSDFSQYTTAATVELKPDYWGGTSVDQSAEVVDNAWDESNTTWNNRPDNNPASPVLTTGGASVWTINNGNSSTISLDVSAQVRQKLRQGDLNFDSIKGNAGSASDIMADVIAFEAAVKDPIAFEETFGRFGSDTSDVLDRGDIDGNGVIDRADAPGFFAVHGELQGQVSGISFLDLQRILGQTATYYEGDFDLSGIGDGGDFDLWSENFGLTPPTPAEEKLSLRVFAPGPQPSSLVFVGYGAKENLNTAVHPTLQVDQDPGLTLGRFDSTPDGVLQVSYNILNEAMTSFDVEVYRSADGVTPVVGAPMMTVSVTDSAKLQPGLGQQLTFQADFSGVDVDEDYYLVAKLAGTGPSGQLDSEVVNFAGGAFQEADRTVHVHGTDTADTIDVLDTFAPTIDFQQETFHFYEGNGTETPENIEVLDEGDTLHLWGNIWRAIDFNYEVTPHTILEFDFSSSIEGEIHAIGFDTNSSAGTTHSFQLHGTQVWGRQDFNNYDPSAGTQHYRIPVGDFYTGTFTELFFANDDDSNPTGESLFSNVRVYEAPSTVYVRGHGDDDDVISDDLSTTTNYLFGGDGNDTLRGGSGANYVYGNAGDDTYIVPPKSPELSAFGAIQLLYEGEGNDTYAFEAGLKGLTAIIPEAAGLSYGNDKLDFSQLTLGLDALDLSIKYKSVNSNLTLYIADSTYSAGPANIEGVIGTAHADVIIGNNLNNYLEGGGGNDRLRGGEGDDTYAFAGTQSLGTDIIVELSNGGVDTLDFSGLDFGTGVDVNLASGSADYEVVDTGTQSVVLDLRHAANELENAIGTIYDDQLVGNWADNVLDGRDGKDSIAGFSGIDQLYGGLGADQLFGGDGDDQIDGGPGRNVIYGGLGNDTLYGGDDPDTIYGEGGSDVIRGNGGDDMLDGGEDGDTIWGGNDNDELIGRGGLDVLYGESGNDLLDAGTNDSGQYNVLLGGDNDDTYRINNSEVTAGLFKTDYFLDSSGVDTLDFSSWVGGTGVTVDLSSTSLQPLDTAGDILLGLFSGDAENILGTAYGDTLTGNSQDNTLSGLGGSDHLFAGGGTNTLLGGEDDDHLHAGTETSTLRGEQGDDHLYGGGKTNHLFGNEGNDHYYVGVSLSHDDGVVRDNLYEGEGNDTYVFGSGHLGDVAILPEAFGLPSGNDTLDFSGMSSGINELTLPDENSPNQIVNSQLSLMIAGTDYDSGDYRGAVGIETVIGTSSGDTIYGNQANNRLEGGAGSDVLESGGGDDILLGQADLDALEAVDDQDGTGYTETGTAWQAANFAGGFNQGQRAVEKESEPGVGLHTSTWSFPNLAAGQYEVFITWAPNPDDLVAGATPVGTSNATAKVIADGSPSSPFTLDQTDVPQGNEFVDRAWQQLGGLYTVGASGTLDIELSNAGADGLVYADAVRIVKFNHAPTLSPLGSPVGELTVAAAANLDVPISASYSDGLASELQFSLAGHVPNGLSIIPDGPGAVRLQWPANGRPQGVFYATVVVTDGGTPAQIASQTVKLTLGTENAAPLITGISGVTFSDPAHSTHVPATSTFSLPELETVEFDFGVTDADNLTYSLAPGAPAGAAIDAAGHFSWTPTEDQDSDESYEITIRVTDDGNPPLRITQTIQVTVNEVNTVPVITSLELLYDTGTSSTDWITSDPRLKGIITNDGPVEDIEILVDYGNNGVFGGTAEVIASESDPNLGTFVFEPDEVFFPVGGTGNLLPLTLTVKAREGDPAVGFQESGTVTRTITPDTANALPGLTVELLNNVGTVGSPESVDGRIKGIVTNADGPIAELDVKIYDVDPTIGSPDPIETIETEEDGSFEHQTEGLVALDTDGDGRVTVSLWLVVTEKTAFATFESAPVPFTYTFLVNEAPRIESLSLLNDTGSNNSDGITTDLTVVGSISHADGQLEGITIEFDDDNNGDVDGVAITDELGNFTYLPVEIEIAPTLGNPLGNLDARALEWDDYQDVQLISLWLDDPSSTSPASILPLAYSESENDPPRVQSLQPLYSTTAGPVANPTVWGTITNDNGLEGVAIEFSFADINPATGHFDSVAGLAMTDDTGRFEFTPAGLEAGTPYTIYARAIEWDDTLDVPFGGDPLKDQLRYDNSFVQSTSLELADSPLGPDSFSGIQLQFDTGTDANNDETSDPALVGTVTYVGGGYSDLEIEFDHDGDDIIDGTVVPDESGTFRYVPEGLIDNEEVTIRARVRVPDYVHRPAEFEDDLLATDWYTSGYDPGTQSWDQTVVDDWFDTIFTADDTAFAGDWYNSDFQLNWSNLFDDHVTAWEETSFTLDLSENDSATVSGVALLNPGSPALDPTITGTVANDGGVAGLKVEFYLNGSTEPDGFTTTDESGNFEYLLQSHTTGSNNVVVRVYEETYDGSELTGDSGPFAITIDPHPLLAIDFLNLKYGSDNGNSGLEAIDPTLTGAVTSLDDPAGLVVRFDYDGNGVADAETTIDGLGEFEFSPEGLVITGSSPQTTTVRAQLVEEIEDTVTGTRYRVISVWTSLTWGVIENKAPTITSLELKHDTGNTGPSYEVLDRVTTDPTIIGQVTNDNGAGQLTVEFDHDGDGTVDGTAVTDENGFFEYTPAGLSLGSWDLRARVEEYDPVIETTLIDTTFTNGWAPMTADGVPTSSTEFYGFTLVAPQQATSVQISHTGTNYDPTITGSVTDPDGFGNLTIEFFLNDNGVSGPTTTSIGSTTVREDGTFEFLPVGLDFASNFFIVAQATEWNYASDSELRSAWDATPASLSRADIASFARATGNSTISAGRPDRVESNNPFNLEIQEEVNFNEEYVTALYVAIDVHNDGTVDAIVPVEIDSAESANSSSTQYRYRYLPDINSPSSSTQISVRPIGRDESGFVFGSWTYYTPYLDQELPRLSGVDGYFGETYPLWCISDDHTSSPTISGTVSAGAIRAIIGVIPQSPIIEFDLNGDGVADESVVADDATSNPSFSYTFSNLSPGEVSIQGRVIRFELVSDSTGVDGETSEYTETITGEWEPIEFTLTDPAPRAVNLGLVNEIGGTLPGETTDPTIRGEIRGDVESDGTTDLFGMTIEIDHDGDGIPEGTTVTEVDGSFEYAPLDLEPGNITLHVRAVDPFTESQQLVGEWMPFSFTLVDIPAPSVTNLELLVDEDEGAAVVSSAPTLTGTVSRDDSVSLLLVEFDHDGDGIADGSVTADYLGNYSYDPTGLSYGDNSIRARGVAQTRSEIQTGDWSSPLDFFYASTEPPVVSDLRVENATTGEISGRVTVDGFGAGATVELAVVVSSNRVSNGFVNTDANGFFTYVPKDIPAGTVELEVRGLLSHASSSVLVDGDWQPVGNFTYTPVAIPASPLVISGFDLAYDTGSSATDNQTADPTLVGSIDFASALVSIEFSHDGGTNIAASVDVAGDGSFEYKPAGLSDLSSLTVHARYRLWDPASGTAVYHPSGWSAVTPVSFTLDLNEHSSATVASLELKDGQILPGNIHSGPVAVFAGQIQRATGNGSLENVLVHFDINGNGTVDGSAYTKADGTFVYQAHDIDPSAGPQTITAYVVEQDYLGQQLPTEAGQSITFQLLDTPLVNDLDYVSTAGTDGQIQGSVQTSANPTMTRIEYQLFGNYQNAPTPPTSLGNYVPNVELQTATIDSAGNFVIDLAAFSLGLGPASIVARVVDNGSGVTGPWETLQFEVASATVAALGISEFGLVEDTEYGFGNDDDGRTSNPTVSGTVGAGGTGAYAVVEIRIDDQDGDPTDDVVRRTTTNAQGFFSYTPEDLPLGQQRTIWARHIAFDPETKQEIEGAETSTSVTLLDNNGAATIVGFGLLNVGTNDPTVKGTVNNDGRTAGLRIEFHVVDAGGSPTEEVHGFAFTDNMGNFEWTPYNIASGQATTVYARVVEWDGVEEADVRPSFGSYSTTFTLSVDGPTDPSMDEEFAGNQDAIEQAEAGAVDAIFSLLGSISGGRGNTDDSIDVGIGSLKLMHQRDADAEDSDVVPDNIFDFIDDVLPSFGSTSVTGQSIVDFDTEDGGLLTGTYDYKKTITDLGNNEFAVHVEYMLDFSSYTNDAYFTESNFDTDSSTTSALGITGIYTFIYDATASYTTAGGIAISGEHDIIESFDYDFLKSDGTTYSDGEDAGTGANESERTSPGDQDYLYTETDSTFDGNSTTQTFSYETTNRVETWNEDSGSDTSNENGNRSTRRWSVLEHTIYSETIVHSGTITNSGGTQTVVGTIVVTASGNQTTDRDESTSYSNSYGSGNGSSGSYSRTESTQYAASLDATTNYTTGQSSTTDFGFSYSFSGSVSESGSGSSNSGSNNYSRSDAWNYDVSSSLNSDSSASGSSTTTYADSGSSRSFSVSVSQSSSFSGGGNSSGSSNYSNNSGGGNTDNGTASGSTSFNSSSSYSENSAVTGTDDQVFVSANGSLQYGGGYRDTTSVSGSSSIPNVENRSYSSRSVTSGGGSGGGSYQTSRSNDHISTSGSFQRNVGGSRLTASQVVGTRQVSDDNGGTETVPFRGNQTNGGSIDVDSSGTYSYTQSQLGTTFNTNNSSTGVTTRKTSGDSRSSSYTDIAGEADGFSLSKSQGSSNNASTVLYTDTNGVASSTGLYSNSSQGTNDSMAVLSSTTTYGNTTVTSNSRSSFGASGGQGSQGIYSVNSSGSSDTGTGFSQGTGYSSSSATTTQTTSGNGTSGYGTSGYGTSGNDSFSFSTGSTGTTSIKSRNTSSGQGIAQYQDGVLQNQLTTSSGDSTSRVNVNTSGNSLNYSRSSSESTSTFTINGSGGSSRANDNSSGTEIVRRDQDGTTRDSSGSSDYSASTRGGGFNTTTTSTRNGSYVDYVTTTSSGNSRSRTSGGGSGTTYQDANSNDYNYQVNNENSGSTSGSTSVEVGRRDSDSSYSETITRTDSSGGESSFNGNISRQGDSYSRTGNVSRSTNGSAGVDLTVRENYSSGSKRRSWTISTSGIESSQEFSFNGQLSQNNDGSTLSGDSSVSNTSTVSSSETDGTRRTLSGGYNQSETTSGKSSSLTKTTNGSVTIKNGETEIGDSSLTETNRDRVFVNRNIQERTRNGDNVHRYTSKSKHATTITDTVTNGDNPRHSETNTFDQEIDSYNKTVDAETSGPDHKIIDTLDYEQHDTTTYTSSGNRESLTSKSRSSSVEETTDNKVWSEKFSEPVAVRVSITVTDDDSGGSSDTSKHLAGEAYSYVNEAVKLGAPKGSEYTNKTTKNTEASYSSSHSLSEDGLVSGGQVSASSKETINTKEKAEYENRFESPDGYLEPSYSSYSSSKTSKSTEETSENGSYSDRRDSSGKVVRVSSGQYTEKSSSSHNGKAESSYESEYEIELTDDSYTSVSKEEALLKDKTSRKYEIKGKYGPNGGSVDVIANDLKENQHYKVHRVSTRYDSYDEQAYKTTTDVVFNETLSIPLKGDPSKSATYRKKVREEDPDLDNQNISYSQNKADDLSAPSQSKSYDTGPSGGGMLSYAAGAAGTIVLNTLDPSGVIRGAAGALGTLALVGATVEYESPWWGGLKAGTYNLFVEQIYGGAKALVTGQAGTALGERGVGIVETQTGKPFTGEASEYGRLGRGIAGDLTGVNGVVEGVYGYDISNQQELDGVERTVRGAGGVSQLAGGAAGALKVKGRFGSTAKAKAKVVEPTKSKVTPSTASPKFDPADYVGAQATTPPHLPAGQYPALVIDGKVYVGRMHITAFELAGKKGIDQFYGFAEIDAQGNVLRLFK